MTPDYTQLPETPGAYLMKDTKGSVLYIGKAANLKRRVSSYFTRPHDARIEQMVSRIHTIEHRSTESALEALMVEADLIKQYRPPYNIREKDDKSFLYVEVTKEAFPRILLVRGNELPTDRPTDTLFGPFVSARDIREALRLLRRIFPYSTHDPQKIGTFKRPCLDAQIGLCPGTCVGRVDQKAYKATIRNLKQVLKGKQRQLMKRLEKEMHQASDAQEFERAAQLRRQWSALQHIQDIALVTRDVIQTEDAAPRIEGYDISNISGTSAVGSMVVFYGDRPAKTEYRKFKIKTITGQDDTGMMREVLGRRLKNNWPLPELILVDGGKGQVNAAKQVLREAGMDIPVVGIAKGPRRDKNEFVGSVPDGIEKTTLVHVRDEAHRFAIRYHQDLRSRNMRPRR